MMGDESRQTSGSRSPSEGSEADTSHDPASRGAPPAAQQGAPAAVAGLAAQVVVPCRADTPRLDATELSTLAATLPEWRLTERGDIVRLERRFPMPNYRAALAFTQQVGDLAEAADHHPVIVTEFARVTVRWWTHVVRGVTSNDVTLAARTDELVAAG